MNLRVFANFRMIFRAWYYFRIGYVTYFSFLLGYLSTFVSIYYLAIKNIPELSNIFPHFSIFTLLGTSIGVPLAVLVGWLHLKRTAVYTAEVEANPYAYKAIPGKERDVFAPTYLELLRQNRKILALNNLLSPEDEKTISKLEKDLLIIISGRSIADPLRKPARN